MIKKKKKKNRIIMNLGRMTDQLPMPMPNDHGKICIFAKLRIDLRGSLEVAICMRSRLRRDRDMS